MKRFLFLIGFLVLSFSICFAEAPSEEELAVEEKVGTDVWNVVKSEDEIMPVGRFKILDTEKNIIIMELSVRGYQGVFAYYSVEHVTSDTYKVEAWSANNNIKRKVTLMFDFRGYPSDIVVKEYHDSDLVQTLYLNRDAFADSDYVGDYESYEKEVFDTYNDFGY